MCDPGAALTVISRRLYDHLNTDNNPMPLRPYVGGDIMSCNLKIKVIGVAQINCCTISKEFSIKYVKMIVMENLSNFDCLMGRDLIAHIPRFSQPTEELRT